MDWVQVPKQRLRDQLAHSLQQLQAGHLAPEDQKALRQECELIANLLQSHGDSITVPLHMAERYGWLDGS